MCGRFTLFSEFDEIIDRFEIDQMAIEDYSPSYNIAPSQYILAPSNTSKIQVDVAQGLETCCRESSECECSGTDPLFLYTPDCTDKVFT